MFSLQCENKLWNTMKYLEAFTNNFLSVPPSALEVAVGRASAKTNLSFTAVEILKPHQILKLCHGSAVITCLPQDLLMAVEVLIKGPKSLKQSICSRHSPSAYPGSTYRHVIFASDVIQPVRSPQNCAGMEQRELKYFTCSKLSLCKNLMGHDIWQWLS